MEFPTIDKFAKDVAEKALDEFIYEGKTIREWVEILVKQQPSDDYISREAVIEEFDQYGENRNSKMHVDMIMDILANFPSVMPKAEPCEACEFYTGDGCSKWECVFEGSDS